VTPDLSLSPELLPFLVGGVLLGIMVGAVPGLTATLAISLLLPLTFQLATAPAIVMMTGIFTGGIYGGSIAAITLRIPGTPASAMTMLDGHAMAQGGRTGLAIALATLSSFVGGVFGGVVLVLFAPQLARVALTFQSPEMFALVVLALVAVATVSPESLLKGMTATVIGLMLATVGIDRLVPVPRYTFASVDLLVGVPLIPVVIGLFAVAELLHQSGEPAHRSDAPEVGSGRLAALWQEVCSVGVGVWVKSPAIGTLVGALPGAGAAMAAFLSYSEAKRSSDAPERFGSGVAEGIVAPESANNAMTGGAFIPMLALGIPGDAVTAVILGGLVMHGVTPGPQLFDQGSELLGPLFGAYFWSYVLILIFGLALIPLFVRITRIPRAMLFPFIGALAVISAFTSEGTTFAMYLTAAVGVLGFVLRRYGYPLIPVLLGLILGPMLESNFRRSMILSEGDPSVFLRSPVAAVLLLAAAAFPLLVLRRRNSAARP
jgi:putative tricarboxylic transport membrane protein